MRLESLQVLHLPKSNDLQGAVPFVEGCVLESCLRWLAILRPSDSDISAQGAARNAGFGVQSPQRTERKREIDIEKYDGLEAYRFLLEVACGLHSKIQGESEIFGQLKQAWKKYHAEQPETSRELHQLMQNLFADTKRIRTNYLHGIGGQSYAGAIQKLLHLRKDQHLLILGAGQFGTMLANKLQGKVHTLTIMNRNPHPLVTQHGWEALEENIAAATHVLVALPAGKDTELDARIQAAWKQKKHGKLLHLAQMTCYGEAWEKLPHFLTLADVMALQQDQNKARPHAIANAFTAAHLAAEARASALSENPLRKASRN